jgi:two-component system sensor histidine kinase TctE
MMGHGNAAARMPDSIFGRMRLLLIAVFVSGAGIAMAAAWIFSTAAATDAYDRLLLSAAGQLSDAIQVDRSRVVALPPDSLFETLGQSTGDRFFFAVRAPNGEVLTGYPGLKVASPAPGDDEPVFGARDFAGAPMRTVTLHRLIAAPTVKGWCSVVVAQTLDARHRLVVRLMLKIGTIIFFVATLGFIGSLVAVRRALAPFDRISRVLAERRAQDTAPFTVDSPRETQALVEAINNALRRLHERMSKLESFTGIAAHQIRTPLSALNAQTELLLTDKTAPARAQRIARLRKHIATLSRLTNQFHFARDRIAMLALAHSHAGRGVWGFERLLALGLAERPGRNLESLKAPKPTKRLTACWRVGQGRAPHRAFEAELLDVLLAYAHLRERRDGETLARARFGHFRTFGSQDASAVAM